MCILYCIFFFFSSRRRHTRWTGDWSSDVCSSDLINSSPFTLHIVIPTIEKNPRKVRGQYNEKEIYPAFIIHEDYDSTQASFSLMRSEERRVGKECRSRWSSYH